MKLITKKIAASLLLSGFSAFVFAQDAPYKPNATEMIDDTQKMSREAESIKMVWWIPEEFWVASETKETAVGMKLVIKKFHPYTVLVVVDAKQIGTNFIYKPDNEVRDGLRIFDSSGGSYAPLDSDHIDKDVVTILKNMKPMFTKLLGEFGEHAVFYLFPAVDSDGKPIASTTGKGQFRVKHGSEEFSFRLPLASLYPKVRCQNDPEPLPGTYKFCPYDGTQTISIVEPQ